MIHIIRTIGKSLSAQILAALFLSVALVMTVVIYVSSSYQNKEMMNEMTAANEEMASAVFAAIRYPMSMGDSRAVEEQLIDLGKTVPDVEVYVVDRSGNITFSSQKNRLSSPIVPFIESQLAAEALKRMLETETRQEQSIEEIADGRRYFLHVHKLENEATCVRCHGAAEKLLGSVILRKSADKQYAALAEIRNRNILISGFGILMVIGLGYALLAKLVSWPIKGLAGRIKRLPEMMSGGVDLPVITSKRTDEIGDLQNSFAMMALELNDKTIAIEETSEELAKANKELEAFAYSVSHDLRAPLRNIDGFSKILLEEFAKELDDQAKHYLRRVRHGSVRMSALIDDMLTFSRIGRTGLQLRKVDARPVIDRIVEYYAEDVAARKVQVTIGDLPTLYCDPTLVQSLFSNLISNALKYSRGVASPRVDIGYDGGKGAFFVKDNGVGFEMQYHDKIFQVFQRLHLPEEYEGTGIGLAIVKRIAERHKGAVWAESSPGAGAVFFVKLPLKEN